MDVLVGVIWSSDYEEDRSVCDDHVLKQCLIWETIKTGARLVKKKQSNTADYFIGIHWEMQLRSFELATLGEEG